MRRYIISILFLLSALGLYAQEPKVRHYSVIFNDLEIWTIGSCIPGTGLKKSEEDEIFNHILSNIDSCKVYYTTTDADYTAKDYRHVAQAILFENDCNVGDGRGYNTIEGYRGKGALHIPPSGEGKVIVYNSEGDMILRILYKDYYITSFEVRKDGTSLYKAEGKFQTVPFEGTVMYEFQEGKIYYKGKLRTK